MLNGGAIMGAACLIVFAIMAHAHLISQAIIGACR